MKKIPSSSPKIVRHGYRTWEFVPQTSPIKKWAAELSQLALKQTVGAEWDMVGHAVILETDDEEELQEMMHSVADEAGLQLHIIDRQRVVTNFPKWFDEVPIDVPSIIYLSPGPWMGGEPDENSGESSSHDADPARIFRQQLIDLLRQKIPNVPIVFVTVGKSFETLNQSLRQVGLFDRRIRASELPDQNLANSFIVEIGHDRLAPSITQQPLRLARVLRHEYRDRRRRGLLQKAMQRLAWREQRALEFDDLLHFVVYGTSEVAIKVDEGEKRRRHAIHEAGHALISHLDSKDRLPPSYCSVLKHDDLHGVMLPSYQGHEVDGDDLSFADVTHKVRVLLGGRAAEHVILGPTGISARGSISDLESATRQAGTLFGMWGISPDSSSDLNAGSNLAVVLGKASDSEAIHVETLIRKFLQDQFLIVLSLINQNKDYLQRIVAALTERIVLVQEDFEQLEMVASPH
jgi:hypothetical protein